MTPPPLLRLLGRDRPARGDQVLSLRGHYQAGRALPAAAGGSRSRMSLPATGRGRLHPPRPRVPVRPATSGPSSRSPIRILVVPPVVLIDAAQRQRRDQRAER